MALPLAFVVAFSPMESFAGGVGNIIQDTQETENSGEGTAAGQEAERIAKSVSTDGFFSTAGMVGAVIIAATIAVALQAASNIIEGTVATTTDTSPTTSTGTTSTGTTPTPAAASTTTGTGTN